MTGPFSYVDVRGSSRFNMAWMDSSSIIDVLPCAPVFLRRARRNSSIRRLSVRSKQTLAANEPPSGVWLARTIRRCGSMIRRIAQLLTPTFARGAPGALTQMRLGGGVGVFTVNLGISNFSLDTGGRGWTLLRLAHGLGSCSPCSGVGSNKDNGSN